MKSVLIGIAGGTGSGKSTFTQRLKQHFADHLTVIYHDNYYHRQDHLSLEERRLINYDHPDSLETALLVEHLRLLRQGKSVEAPLYDFSIHNRADETVTLPPTAVIIVEGILVLQDKDLRESFDLKIYVQADADERILRRVNRDISERGRSLDDIVRQYLDSVKPMHNLYVEPTKALADIVINSAYNGPAFDLLKTKIESIIRQDCAVQEERD
ncbi:MAG: uridine kinase [Succinivibrio sp.]|nr:uridine kinase [Succinivibrio sp.]